jgi:aminopeptidase N
VCGPVALAAASVLLVAACSGASGVASESDAGATPPSASTPDPTDSTMPASPTEATTGATPEAPAARASADVPARWQAAVSTPVEDPYFPKTSNPEIDVLHYDLHLDYAQVPRLSARAVVTFRAARSTDQVRLDLSQALDVKGVRLDGREAAYTHPSNGLVPETPGMDQDTVHRLAISYAGVPKAAPAHIARFDPRVGLGWQTGRAGEVYTFQEPYGAWSWYPSNDHPSDEAYYDATITTKVGSVGVFNGRELGGGPITSHGTTTTRWHLDQPAASYLTTLAIGGYHEYTATTPSGMTLSFWLLQRDKQYLPTLRREAVRSYEWLVDHAGPYPFKTLGFVVVGGDDAMETQTMITLSRSIFNRPDSVIEHELAHQWFGDSVSPIDWKGLWLNEGWAMYMQQWYESDLGLYEYAGGIDQWRPYDDQARQTAGPPANYDPDHFGDLNVYLGPAMMLDKIRQRIGDAEFAEFVKAWAADHAGQNVDRGDFTRWANQQTGIDLTSLINRWLDAPHTPPF